ncbi:MAG: 16S rRNA (cytosine(1402)-N(4))-methyltransferase RsmH [Patescibacteria group bacterium]|jgi:16S rRNA (cytosine1402-N4)-methyltransferase
MYHQPVLLAETIKLLDLRPGDSVIDGTIGGGGHGAAILAVTQPDGLYIGGDLDPDAITATKRRLKPYGSRVHIFETNFTKLPRICHEQFPNIPIRAVLLDLGVSSHELESTDRGFSFLTKTAPLDMRMGRNGLTAADVLNAYSESELRIMLQRYGEERFAGDIADAIVNQRRIKKFEIVGQLVDLVTKAYREKLHSKKDVPWVGGRHPATLTFQALRIEVNDELGNLRRVLPEFVGLLMPGGRMAVITFHSLEDKIVKKFIKRESMDCICPPEYPDCRCGHRATVKAMVRKGTAPSPEEIKNNPRSRSARLRVMTKI